MVRSKEENLEFYLKRLDEVLNTKEVKHITVCSYANAIARTYDAMGETDEATKYFSIAAEACLEDLHRGLGAVKILPLSLGDDLLRCGQILWRSGDDRASTYFQQALESYREGYESGTKLDRIFCWSRSVACLIFLEEFESALDTIKKSREIKRELGHRIRHDPSEILIDILENLLEGDEQGAMEAVSRFGTFMKRRRISFISRRPAYFVDVYEFLKRRSRSIH